MPCVVAALYRSARRGARLCDCNPALRRHLLTRFAADASLQENFGNAEMREVALVPTNRTACYAGS